MAKLSILKQIEEDYGEFSAIRDSRPSDNVARFSRAQYEKLIKILGVNEPFITAEWIARHYLASKKISLAALYFTQSEVLLGQGMKNLSFYACYYSLFSALSANVLLNTDFQLDKVREISHSALARDIENYYVRIGVYDGEVVRLLDELRFCRELYSYHLPLSGDVIHGETILDVDRLHDRLSKILPLCIQVSDMQSYLSYYAWESAVGRPHEFSTEETPKIDELFWSIVTREGKSALKHQDRGDYYLLAYFLKSGRPIPITWLINEKVLEEVECGWGEESEMADYHIGSVARYLAKVTGAF
ncbi:MAG: hypothetical protein ACKVLM_11660 [Pseudomonadales bacterium]